MVAPPSMLGLVLAAGLSRRMGRSKALLICPESSETFVARAVRILREGGLDHVSVVVRPADQAVRASLGELTPPPRVVENPVPEAGQLSSIVAGIDHAEALGADGVVVLPVDMPLVRAASVAALLNAARGSRAPLLRVVHAGRSGHPVLFRRPVFERLRATDPAVGARAVFLDAAGDVLEVPVEDPGVLRDVDRPEEYRQLFEA